MDSDDGTHIVMRFSIIASHDKEICAKSTVEDGIVELANRSVNPNSIVADNQEKQLHYKE